MRRHLLQLLARLRCRRLLPDVVRRVPRADAVPAVFTRIALHFVVTGRELKESHVRRAVELSAEKYCSASIMLGAAGVDISHSFEIVEEEDAA